MEHDYHAGNFIFSSDDFQLCDLERVTLEQERIDFDAASVEAC